MRRRILVRHHPSAFLLGAQLLSLVLYAASMVHSGRALLGAFSAIVLALAVWVVSRTPAINWIAW